MLNQSRLVRHLLMVPVSFVALGLANAQDRPKQTRQLITQAVDDSRRVKLSGNTRPEANAANDRGRVPESLFLDHMQLQLRLPIEKEEELDEFLREVQDPKSPNYHKWLTPEQFSQEFSLAPEDIRAISEWLRSQGFRINLVGPRLIDFSGTAGQVRNAFKTEIHYLDVKGVRHIANMSDPQVPATLAPAVVGVVSLNDFKPHPVTGDN